MSKELIITEAGKAKVSWKVLYNDEVLDNSSLQSIVLNVNGEAQNLDMSKNEVEIDINKTSKVNMEVKYNNMATKTSDLTVILQQEEVATPFYYGTLAISENHWDKGGEQDIMDYLESISADIVKDVIDDNPHSTDKGSVAHAGYLVKSNAANPFNKEYGFEFADSNEDGVWCSQAVVLYPSELGEIGEIKDASGATMSKDAWYFQTIELDGVEYYIYILKDHVSNEGYTYITINQ